MGYPCIILQNKNNIIVGINTKHDFALDDLMGKLQIKRPMRATPT